MSACQFYAGRALWLVLLLSFGLWRVAADESQAANSPSSASSASSPDTARDEVRYFSGTKFDEALKLRGRVVYERSPLRKVVAEFQKTSRLPIVVDRRINPDQRVTIRTQLVTNRTTLVTLADQLDAKASFGRCYVYIGPVANAESLQTRVKLLEDALLSHRKTMEASLYRQLSTKFDGSWGRLSQPRVLLQERAATMGVTLDGADVVPHDLWNAAILPSLSFADYASLILTQFDLELTLDETGHAQLQPHQGPATIERRHRVRNRSAVVRRWRQSLPNVEVVWKGSTAVVVATVEQHQMLEMLAKGEQPPTDEPGGLRSQTFTFRTPPRTRLGTVLASLQAQGVPVRLVGRTEAELQDELNQIVEIREENTPAAQFFPRVLAGLNGQVDVTDDEVIVTFE